jgi:hypothetical protein
VVEGLPLNIKAQTGAIAGEKRGLLERMGETMKEDKILNLAYGSNLNLEQMAYRCPTAKIYGRGMLLDYQLLFKGREDNAYATIEPKRGSKVPVLVWELQPEDEKALDYYEGYPRFYEKKDVELTLETGEKVTAMVYIMTDEVMERIQLNLPRQSYLETVKAGYARAGFDKKYIEAALGVSGKGKA